MKKLTLVPLLMGGITLLAGCDKAALEPRTIVVPVSVAEVFMAQSAPQLTFPAVAAAADKSSLSFRVQGEVSFIGVRPGDMVKKGQLLARLDPTDYKLEVDDAQAKFNVSDSQYRRSAKLVKQGFLPQSQFDELRAQRRIAKARLDYAKLNLSFTELKAPFSGVISRVPVEQFENVQVGQLVMNLHLADQVDIIIQAPDMIYSQSTAVEVQESQPKAIILLEDGSEFKAQLKEFTTEPDPNLGSFLVTLTMPMPEDRFILDGMAVQVKADAQKLKVYRKGEAVIPLEAIVNEDGDDLAMDNKFVWVVNDDNTVTKRKVVTDKVVPEGVRLLEGLEAGEHIVVEGANRLREGQSVTIVDKEAG
ncbi:efflux RND transporter periplasmic adaptor subunit [Photobacterium lutimaris]|uniref:Efflux RND transporter periplasmic adaptor subunit n=1 Tax=Photobacterium lutimaris TaxID=388278 RepID=A0A2T3J231_9GAMM|nr:efflux RND transporter periplasmic adaptor subunit [Photobacterium lutimaris]PSU35132.1 efflux RND transporter periplasmic adaptor subunit [Photobacterium lutimaris]TDR77494.1 RND family efflux transporter MFP subunit [Photobacterium lutimaris]